jgi:hypothetical protein
MCAKGENISGPVGLMGGDANITIGYSRFELKVGVGYAQSAP